MSDREQFHFNTQTYGSFDPMLDPYTSQTSMLFPNTTNTHPDPSYNHSNQPQLTWPTDPLDGLEHVNLEDLYNPYSSSIPTGPPFNPPIISIDTNSAGMGPSSPSQPYSTVTPSPTSAYTSSPENVLRTPLTPATGYYDPHLHVRSASHGSPMGDLGWNLPPPPAKQEIIASRPRAASDSRPPVAAQPKGRGEMVPQKRYKPHTTSDRRRYVEEVELERAITFYTLRPEIDGISLVEALSSKFANLAGRDDPMFQERGPSISVRINWPGYNSWSRQIPTRDFRTPPGPITRAKLAKNVAKSVQRFIQDQSGKAMEEDADPRWRVGPTRPYITLNDLALVRLDHVSKGSWQAQLCLVHPRSS